MDLNDNALMVRISKGDEKAFEHLFRTYYKPLCQFSYTVVKDTSAAEEIVQDLFFHFWEKRQYLVMQHSVKSYLYKSTHNNSLKYLRHRKIVTAYESNLKESKAMEFELQENYAEMEELSAMIMKTLQSVSERTREIFRMNRDEGLKYHEIASKLNISVKTVEAHISGLLKLFRENLREFMFMVFIILWKGIG